MRVIAAARNRDLLVQLPTRKANGHALEIVRADVATAEGREAMVRAATEKFGGLDVLVNNAGIGATGHFAESSPDAAAVDHGDQLLRHRRDDAGVPAVARARARRRRW